MKYVVDTSLINKLVDGTVGADELPNDGSFVASHIQIDELNRTTNAQRKVRLLQKFAETIDEILPTELLDEGRPGDGDSYNAIKRQLDSLNGAKANNSEDALIAEVAMRNGYALLTADYHLYQVAYTHGVGVMYWTTPVREAVRGEE